MSSSPYGLTFERPVPESFLAPAPVITHDWASQLSVAEGVPTHLHPILSATKVTPLSTGGSKSDEGD